MYVGAQILTIRSVWLMPKFSKSPSLSPLSGTLQNPAPLGHSGC